MRLKFVVSATIVSLSLCGLALAQGRQSARRAPIRQDPSAVPAYHAAPSRQPLPTTLDPGTFSDALNQNVYAMAAKVKNVLYQQPCYCHCDQHVGHQSLLDCFVDNHASMCAVCKSEAVYSYTQARKGEKAAAIRQAIIAGAWKTVDLTPYTSKSNAR